MKRLTLIIPSLTSGGAERVMTTLANAWAADGRAVTLLTLDDGSQPPFYPLDSAVKHRALGVAGASGSRVKAVTSNLRRILLVRRAISRSNPDVVLSFLDTTNVLTLLATRGLGLPVVVEEHTDPAQKRIGGWEPLRRLLYPHASRVVLLSETARSFFGPNVRARSAIIPNPIVVEPPGATEFRPTGRRTLVAMGRFGPEKGFDLLLDAFARIAASHPEWSLTIWGDGPLRPELERQRDELRLGDRVSMPGRTTTPHAELRVADLFVMSSRREGFPMALGEAMACGLAVVSADCPSGPRQLIRHEIDGLLVAPEDPAALATGLSRAMGDDELRTRLAERAPDVLNRFGLDRVMAIWDELFAEITQPPRKNRTKWPARADLHGRSGSYDAVAARARDSR